MKEDKQHIDYFELMPKYLSGNATDAEVQLLEEWVLSSDANRDDFKAFKQAWILSGIQGNPHSININEAWKKTSGELFGAADTKVFEIQSHVTRRFSLFQIAAAASVLLLVSFWVFNLWNQPSAIEFATVEKVKENSLPDGSQVALNQFTALSYVPSKNTKYRKVKLEGDAFFEVQRDEDRPFIIEAEAVEIEVLGTEFYVDAREGVSEIQVIVKSGSVAVSAGTQKVLLAANEVGIYDKSTKRLSKQVNEDINYMSWKTDKLFFENETLEKVVFDLNRKFHSNLSIGNPALNACEITATYSFKSLETILLIIEKTLNIKAVKQGDAIVFEGEGCE